MFDIYKQYYQFGLFTADDIRLFQQVGQLTADQVQQILGNQA